MLVFIPNLLTCARRRLVVPQYQRCLNLVKSVPLWSQSQFLILVTTSIPLAVSPAGDLQVIGCLVP